MNLILDVVGGLAFALLGGAGEYARRCAYRGPKSIEDRVREVRRPIAISYWVVFGALMVCSWGWGFFSADFLLLVLSASLGTYLASLLWAERITTRGLMRSVESDSGMDRTAALIEKHMANPSDLDAIVQLQKDGGTTVRFLRSLILSGRVHNLDTPKKVQLIGMLGLCCPEAAPELLRNWLVTESDVDLSKVLRMKLVALEGSGEPCARAGQDL